MIFENLKLQLTMSIVTKNKVKNLVVFNFFQHLNFQPLINTLCCWVTMIILSFSCIAWCR